MEFSFTTEKTGEKITVFTTRPDTVYGVSYIVLAPEHPLVETLSAGTEQELAVREFKNKMEKYDEIARTSTETEKEGLFIGSYAINPISGEKVPIWTANYVLLGYGTGAVMGVPAHDQRDFEFAKKYNLPIKVVITPEDKVLDSDEMTEAYIDEGILVNSGSFNGMNSNEAIKAMGQYMKERDIGELKVNYKLRDWLISRQRYWGAPIPIVYCDKCGVVPVPEEDLPVLLPEDVELTSHNASPLNECENFCILLALNAMVSS